MTGSKFFSGKDTERAKLINIIVLLAMSGCLASCDRTHSTGNNSENDPVLAVVGGDEITLSAVRAELSAVDARDDGSVNLQQQKQALEALIDRDIVAHDAMRRKIDRDPAVADVINREKAKILVQAYLRELAEAAQKPSQEDIDNYYKDHFAEYSERKLFKADELTIATLTARQQVRAMSDAGNSMRQILLWLDEHNVPYILKRRLITGDKLPSGLAEMSGSLANGKPFIVDRQADFQIWAMTVLGRQPQSEDVVKQQIERLLIDQRAHDELAASLTKLRATDGVVYPDASRKDWLSEPVAAGESPYGINGNQHVPLAEGVTK